MLNVWIVLFPARGEIDEERAIEFIAVASGRSVGTLIVLALMPDDRENAMSQLGLLDSPKLPTVDRVDVSRVGVIALMLDYTEGKN